MAPGKHEGNDMVNNTRVYSIINPATGTVVAERATAREAYNERHRLEMVLRFPLKIVDPIPYVGMPATHHIGSDSYGGEIVAVSPTAHRCTFQRVDGCGARSWTHEYTRRRSGEYVQLGGSHGHLTLGESATVLDPGF